VLVYELADAFIARAWKIERRSEPADPPPRLGDRDATVVECPDRVDEPGVEPWRMSTT
jgi:hypothetical protein